MQFGQPRVQPHRSATSIPTSRIESPTLEGLPRNTDAARVALDDVCLLRLWHQHGERCRVHRAELRTGHPHEEDAGAPGCLPRLPRIESPGLANTHVHCRTARTSRLLANDL